MPKTADSPELGNGGTGLGINQRLKICFYLPSGIGPGAPITAVATTTYQWMPSLGLGISPITIRSEATGRLESGYDRHDILRCAGIIMHPLIFFREQQIV